MWCVCVMGKRGGKGTIESSIHGKECYTHFHVEMGPSRIGSHQRFYGFEMTILRCLHQRRHIVAAFLGGWWFF